MPLRATNHPLWVFIPKGTPVMPCDRGYYDPTKPENQTSDDCTTIVYRHKRNGRWSPQAFTDHAGVPGHNHRVYLDWTVCTKLKDGGTLSLANGSDQPPARG
jgi:hypothetical protein